MKKGGEIKINLDFIPETIQAEIKERILSGVCPVLLRERQSKGHAELHDL